MSSVARAATPSRCFDNLTVEHHSSHPISELGGGDGDVDGGHWNRVAYECEVGAGPDGSFDFVVEGGSDNGEFPFIGGPPDYIFHRQLQRGTDHHLLSGGDILLEINGQKVAGYTQRDIVSWLGYCARTCCNRIRIKAVKTGYLTKDLRQYLNARFQKGSLDHDLQNTIRDNLYLRTVPCTTRSPRCGEINGVDYTFLTVDEFVALERSGNLLESGIYEGNLYGTPRPAPAASAFSASVTNLVPSTGWIHKGNFYGSTKPLTDVPHSPAKHNNSAGNCGSLVIPGAHASSEGKRRRNRSNVEAMASKTSDASEYSVYPPHTRSSTPVSNLSNGIIYKSPKSSTFSPVDRVFLDLPPQNIDPNCSDSYYFGYNTSGSSLWRDPRLSALPRTSIEEPCDNDLPFGWERIDDPHYGTYYIDHVNRRTQYENPVHIGPDPNLVSNKMSCRSLSWNSNKSGQRSDNSRSTVPRSPGSEVKTSPRTSRNSSLTQTTNCSNTRDSITPANTNSESLLIEGNSLHTPLNSPTVAPPGGNPLSASPASTHRFPYLHCIPCLNEKHEPPKHPIPSDASQSESGGGLLPNGTLANEVITKKADDGEPPAVSPVTLPGSASSYRTVDSRFTPPGLSNDSACRDFSKPSSLTGLVTQRKRPSAFFSRNPEELKGTFLRIPLVKSSRGLGFTIIGGSNPTTQELLQIKDVVPYGPAWCDGQMQTGDVLVYVNSKCVLGYTHNDIISQFQSIPAGEIVELQICRGYPLPFDPSDPNTEIVTTVAVSVANAKGLDCQNVYSVSQADNAASMNMTTAKSTDPMTRATKSMPDLSARRAEHNGNGTLNLTMEHSETFSGAYPNDGPGLPSYLTMDIIKGTAGFGFTIADSCYGQKVKKILDRPRCKQLQEGDVLAEINGQSVLTLPHAEVVQILKDCPCGEKAQVSVQRGGFLTAVKNKNRSRARNFENESKWNDAKFSTFHSSSFYQSPVPSGKDDKSISSYRSKTPTAELYSSRDKDPVVVPRPKTPLVDSRNWIKSSPSYNFPRKPSNLEVHLSKSRNMSELNNCDQLDRETSAYLSLDEHHNIPSLSRENSNQNSSDHNDSFFQTSKGMENSFSNDSHYNSHFVNNNKDHIHGLSSPENRMNTSDRSNMDTSITNSDWKSAFYSDFNSPFGNTRSLRPSNGYSHHNSSSKTNHSDPFTLYKNQYPPHLHTHFQNNRDSLSHTASPWNDASLAKENCFPNNMSVFSATSFFPDSQLPKKHSTSFEHAHPMPYSSTDLISDYSKSRNLHSGKLATPHSFINMFITLHKQNNGFGFRIVGGTEEGSQASVGHIVPGGAADVDGRLRTGDEILGVDGNSVVSCSHRQVVQLMNNAATSGKVTLHIRRPNTAINGLSNAITSKFSENVPPYDVTVTRNENEGFGFVLISSVNRPGSTIGRLIDGSPADRCGQLRLGDVIQAVNGINILHMHHGDIVSLIKDSGYSVVLTVTHPQDDSSSITSASQKGEESSLDPDDSFHSVELQRGAKGFGFSIRGGREFHNMPLFILRIAENGAAHQDGRLQVGDQIVEINGVFTKNMTHAEAIELIRAGGNIVRLLIKRNSLSFSAENAHVYHHLLPSTSESPPLQITPNLNETTCQTSQ